VQSILESAGEQDLLEGLTLRCGLARGDVGAEDGCVAQGGEPGEGGRFDNGFCKGHSRSTFLFRGLYSSHIFSIGFSSNVFLIIGIAFGE